MLSEGEQRVVAIASFLAELEPSAHLNGIVFDDPVCSLDHLWRNEIAKRLAQEGLNRQVIIFTHDIVFLLALQKEAKQNEVDILIQNVNRRVNKIGYCNSDIPWIASNVKKRIGKLRDLFQIADKSYRNGDLIEYQKKAEYIYDFLRKTWERTIEEVLFCEVIERFSSEIHTKNLKKVKILNGDYNKIERGMSKCSQWLHDQPPAMNLPFPEPTELNYDIEELANFVNEIRKRN